MEIPCLLKFDGSSQDSGRVEKLIPDAMGTSRPPTSSDSSSPSFPKRVNDNKRKMEMEEETSSVQCYRNEQQPQNKKGKFSALSSEDKDNIITGSNLLGKHISFAEDLLKGQYNNINGLECTLLQWKSLPASTAASTRSNKAQIFHDRDNHCIAASNMPITMAVKVKFWSLIQCTTLQTSIQRMQLLGNSVCQA